MAIEYKSQKRLEIEYLKREQIGFEMRRYHGASLTPQQIEEEKEIGRKLAEAPAEPPDEIKTAIAEIQRAYPYASKEQDNEQRAILDRLYDGEITTEQAWHMVHRQKQRQCIANAFDHERCHLAWESYLENSRLQFPPRPIQTRLAVEAAQTARLLTLYGASGLGKSTAAIRGIVMRSVERLSNRRAVAVSGSTLSRMSPSERSDFVERVTHSQASLLLDDIDKGAKTAEGVSSAILEIIEAREHMEALTIITTNCNGVTLSKKIHPDYGAPIVTRIKRGIVIDFDPEDIDEAECREEIEQRLFKIIATPIRHPAPRRYQSCL